MKLPFWKPKKSEKELQTEDFHARLTKSEDTFLDEQAEIQCRSKNSILREFINKAKKDKNGIKEEHI